MGKTFESGQKVIIKKPASPEHTWSDDWRAVGWVTAMDQYVGQVATISHQGNLGVPYYNMKNMGFDWHPDWLVPVDEHCNQYNNSGKCKWCEGTELKKKFVPSLEFEYQYCPECGR